MSATAVVEKAEAAVATAPACIIEVFGHTCEARDAEAHPYERTAYCKERPDEERNYRLPARPEVLPTDRPHQRIEKQQRWEADMLDVPVNVSIRRSHGRSTRQQGYYVVQAKHIWRLNFRVCTPKGEDAAGTTWSEPFFAIEEAKDYANADGIDLTCPYPVGDKHRTE